MSSRSPSLRMWIDAAEMLDRAERLHRRFFELGRASTQAACWEPPCDVLENEDGLFIEVALPGVAPQSLEASFVSGSLVIAGERRPPAGMRYAAVRRLEIPYGRFERRLPLPAGRYELVQRELVDGCLKLSLRKLA